MATIFVRAFTEWAERASSGYTNVPSQRLHKGLEKLDWIALQKAMSLFTENPHFKDAGPIQTGMRCILLSTLFTKFDRDDRFNSLHFLALLLQNVIKITSYLGSVGAFGKEWNEEVLDTEISRRPKVVEMALKKSNSHIVRKGVELGDDILILIIALSNLFVARVASHNDSAAASQGAISKKCVDVSSFSNGRRPINWLHLAHCIAKHGRDTGEILYSASNIWIKLSSQIPAHHLGLYKFNHFMQTAMPYLYIARLVTKVFCNTYVSKNIG